VVHGGQDAGVLGHNVCHSHCRSSHISGGFRCEASS
jgi:hypothetical protein